MEGALEPIFPISALQKRQREVKEAARAGVVRITENGAGAYVFCTEETFQRKLDEAAESAAYEARVAMAVERGRADIAAGRYVTGVEAALEEIEGRARG